jgi:hypothetical protein
MLIIYLMIALSPLVCQYDLTCGWTSSMLHGRISNYKSQGGFTMKKSVILVMSLLFVFAAALAFAAKGQGPSGKFEAKAGDAIYVCGCGDGCDCGSLALKEGSCSCGKELVKTTVTKVDKSKVYYELDGKEMSAPIQGKYACGCGDGCNCGAISQKPGKCGCDKDMVKVSPPKKK